MRWRARILVAGAILFAFILGRTARNSVLISRLQAEADKIAASNEEGSKPSDPLELAVVERAAMALGDVGCGRAVPALATLLKHRDPSVRSHAATALGRIRSKKAVVPLIEVLEEASPANHSPRKAASVALWRIIGEAHGMDAGAWRQALGLTGGPL